MCMYDVQEVDMLQTWQDLADAYEGQSQMSWRVMGWKSSSLTKT